MDAKAQTKTSDIAAQWIVRMEAGPLLENEQRELDEWLAAAPQHRGALIRARAMWLDLDRLGALAGPVSDQPLVKIPAKKSFAATRRWLLAASVATLFVAGGVFVALTRNQNLYESGIGEIRRVTLIDGSSMLLNSASHAAVQFDAAKREVRLERGEAMFEVKKDRTRPFVVRADKFTVRAIGTAFSVRVEQGALEVIVTEGIVEVADSQGDARRVLANEHAVVQSRQGVVVAPIESDVASRHLAWRDGMVNLQGESLVEAVAEINRYSKRQIVIDDESLRAKPVVGIFRIGDVEGFSQAAATALGAKARRDGNVIRLEPIQSR